LSFDAIGGGHMAATILASMERALLAQANGYSRYGSPITCGPLTRIAT
jgi:hypothetical protein